MNGATLWIVWGLTGVVILSGLALAGLERVRGLRAESRADGTVRPARALAVLEMVGGAAVVLLAVVARAWWPVGVGLWILSLGAAEFVQHVRLRSALQWAGYAILIAGVAIERLAR